MMSTEGREAIIWIRLRADIERGHAQIFLRKRVNAVRKDLGLPSRQGEAMLSIRESAAAFKRSMERVRKALDERKHP